MSSWTLPREIISLSRGNNWHAAIAEWRLEDIEILDEGEYESCLCGHYPIRELCHIRNDKNGNIATVGNVCITKFGEEELAGTDFGSVPRIINAVKRIYRDDTSSANKDLIDYAERIGVFSCKDANFYRDIWRKRNLSDPQENYKQSLNYRLLSEVRTSKKTSYQVLKNYPNDKHTYANFKLINYASSKQVLSFRDHEFYVKMKHRIYPLTEKQLAYKNGLNRRIVERLRGDFDVQANEAASDAVIDLTKD